MTLRRRADVGLAFTLGRGHSLVWSGWDSGAPRVNNGMTARLPPALEDGKPMVRRIRDEFHIGTRAAGNGEVVRLNYAAVSTDTGKARLTVRDREADARDRDPVRRLGICRQSFDPAAAGGGAVRADQDLRDLVRGDRGDGDRRRFCRDPRPRLVSAP